MTDDDSVISDRLDDIAGELSSLKAEEPAGNQSSDMKTDIPQAAERTERQLRELKDKYVWLQGEYAKLASRVQELENKQ